MNDYHFDYIANWTEIDLLELSQEDETHEYKSSQIKDKDLGQKISIAASAFWNSGGGVFIAGLNDDGSIDGGLSNLVGRQHRRDWVDQYIKTTEPQGTYWIKIIDSDSSLSNTKIKPDQGVLVIGFEASLNAPHMAYDRKYYIRAGAHSAPAGHFLVEAIRSYKHFQSPQLIAALRRSERRSNVVELAIKCINDATALNVQISFNPLPKAIKENFSDRFPLAIPFIDKETPFYMELYYWRLRLEMFGEKPVELQVSYNDLTNKMFTYTQTIDVTNSIGPMTIGETDLEAIAKAIEKISVQLTSKIN